MRRTPCPVLLCLVLSGGEAVSSAAQEKKAAERPSQAAVLGKNTVVRLDLRYGPDEKQRLDVYAPRGMRGVPLVIFVHGGEWTKGDKAAVSFKPKFFNEHGIAFASINYRLSPAVRHPAHVSDVAKAVAWLRGHAADFGADPNKLVLMGHSAGCHLATLVALDPRYLGQEKLRPADLRAVVAWSGGMYDLADRVKGSGSYPKYIRQAFGDTEAAWRDASPVTHVGAAAMPPFLFVSVEKGNASHKAAENIAALIRTARGKAESRVLTGRTHFTANHLIGAPGDSTGLLLLDFIREVTLS